ncbi:MAG: hypothetical protein NTY46_11340 [Candidatus Sumerlaeota bacterium]|nr:hypothetical protein [Candidatus Sumerlaeota bacterium]
MSVDQLPVAEQEMPEAPPQARHVDHLAEIVAHLWKRRWFIIKFVSAAIVIFTAVLFLIPKRYKGETIIIILPPRFISDVRTEALTVTTARTILDTSESSLKIIERIKLTKTIVDEAVKQFGYPAGIDKLMDMTADDFSRLTPPVSEQVSLYLADLGREEFNAVQEWKWSDINDLTVDELSKSLESEEVIEKKTVADIKFSPLIKLYAVADTGPKAQLIANTWASVFEEKYNDITNKKTRRQYQSIVLQQRESEAEFQDIQTSIVKFKSLHNLELYQRLIDVYSEDFRGFMGQLIQKRSALGAEKRKLARLHQVLTSMEGDGQWVGKINFIESDAEPTTSSVLMARETTLPATLVSETSVISKDEPPVKISSSEQSPVWDNKEKGDASQSNADELLDTQEFMQNIRGKALESRIRLKEAISQMRKFSELYPLELMDKDRDKLQSEYIEAQGKLRMGQIRIVVLQKTIATLDTELSTTPKFIVLSKDVPDVTIADAATQGRRSEVRAASDIKFKREELNPVWSSLIEQKTKQDFEYEMMRNEVDLLRTLVPGKEIELKSLQMQIDRATIYSALAKENLSNWVRASRELYDSYVDTNNEIHNTARLLAFLQEEVRQLEEESGRTGALAEKYQQLYNEAAATLNLLESNQRAIKRNSDLLMQKLQDAQTAVRQEMSDVSMAAAAVTPQKHYFPKRMISLAVLTALTGLLLIAGLARQKLLELKVA